MTRGGSTYYYHLDGLGSVKEITDSTGSTVEKYRYDVYGQPAIFDGSDNPLTESAIGNSYMFTGRRYDKESGLYYYRVRYYKPEIGRFIGMDPVTWGPNDSRVLYENEVTTFISDIVITYAGIRNPELFQRYSYVSNNPINWKDPTGLWLETAIDVISTGHSISLVWRKPTDWKNWAWLANDVVALILPIYSGVYAKGVKYGSKGVKSISKVKKARGITKITRNLAERRKYLKSIVNKCPKWMKPWLRKGKVPPGYQVHHLKALSAGGKDVAENMRLITTADHKLIHKFYRPWIK